MKWLQILPKQKAIILIENKDKIKWYLIEYYFKYI
jgi:hypothetical protein